MQKILIFVDELSSDPTEDELDTQREAEEVKIALVDLGYDPIISQFSLNLEKNIEIIKSEPWALIFNLVETLNSNTMIHIAPLLFEIYNVKYSGGNSQSLFITSDKVYAKKTFRNSKIRTADYYWVNSKNVAGTLINKEVIVKPINDEASSGINDSSIMQFSSAEDIKNYIKDNQTLFIEEYIKGKEYNVSVMKIEGIVKVLPIAQMQFIDFPKDKPKILNYNSKWDEESFEYKHTIRTFKCSKRDSELMVEFSEITKKCYSLFGNKGYMRVDFRTDEYGIPYVLEVNVNPCISSDSGFVAAANENGMSYNDLIQTIVKGALNE
ncbi:MAG: ATP-grasp domain-containing protein [Spirochaetaceae bacterium]|nr:ATP-grasp domain-containing protein [Spirochaetaceae bacterium]